MTTHEILNAVGHVLTGRNVAVIFSKDLKRRVRVTRKQVKYRVKGTDTLIVTVDKLNYAEREFVKMCKKAKSRVPKIWFPKG